MILFLKTDENVPFKSNKNINLRKKIIFLLVSCRKEQDPDLEVCGVDPDPYQDVTDPQHLSAGTRLRYRK